jgi:hypothetical protein
MTEPARKKICLSITPSTRHGQAPNTEYQIQVTVDNQPISSTIGLFQPSSCVDPAAPCQIEFLSDKLSLGPTTVAQPATPPAAVVPGPAATVAYHSKVVAALKIMEMTHPAGSPQLEALRQKSLNILKQMLGTYVGQALALRDGWVGPNCPTVPTCCVDLQLLASVRSTSESIYKFWMHYMNDVMHQNVPEVGIEFRPRFMCAGFVFVPIGADSGSYSKNLPAQLIATNGEDSIPWGAPVGTNGGNFNNDLARYRLPTLDEIMAMFSKRAVSDPSIF